MVFRRSLVRELTATAVALFLVLLGILFTNLVLRLLARAAGGTVAPEGILALLGFNALFYFNILLSVALFLTVLLTLSRWYRDSEMIVWFTSGQSLTAWLKPILWFATPFLLAIVVLSLWLSPWAEAAAPGVRAPARIARGAVAADAGTVQGISPGEAGRVHRKHQLARRHDQERVPALDRQRKGRHDRRPLGSSRRRAQRRPLHRAAGRPPLRGDSRQRRVPHGGIREPRTPHRAGGSARAAGVAEGAADRVAGRWPTARRSGPSCSGGYRCRSAPCCWCCWPSRWPTSTRGWAARSICSSRCSCTCCTATA